MSDVSLFAAILAGAASFVSPCVLPLLPGYISLMSGYSLQDLSDGNVSMRRVVGMTAPKVEMYAPRLAVVRIRSARNFEFASRANSTRIT